MALCTSPGCVIAAAELISDMSPNYKQIDPCQDFRKFTCEGFDRTHSLRQDQSSLGTSDIMQETVQAVLRQILESPSADDITKLSTMSFSSASDEELKSGAKDYGILSQECSSGSRVASNDNIPGSMILGDSTEQANFQKIQIAYNACINETAIEEMGNEPLFDLLSKLESIDQGQGTDVTKAIDYLLGLGQSALIDLEPIIDGGNPDQHIISLKVSPLGLSSKQFYKDRDKIELYRKTISTVLEGLSRTREPSAIQSLIEFESRIAEATPDPEQAHDPEFSYNPRNITEVEKLLPQVSVSSLIQTRIPGYSGEIIVRSPAYLQSLSRILKETSEEIVNLYFHWKLILGFSNHVESDAVKPLLEFNNILRDQDPEAKPERWRTCVRHIDSGLSWILSYYYVNVALSRASKDFGDRVIYDIKESFVDKIQNSQWMTKEDREVAVKQVHTIRQKVGFPTKSPNLQDPRQLQKLYSGVSVTENSFFANVLSM